MTKRNCVITIHGPGLARKAEERVRKILLPQATLIICQSDSVFRKLISWGALKDKVTLIKGSSVDTEKFKPKNSKPSTQELVVTFVGRLVPFRGPRLFIDSIPFVLSSYRNVVFQLVGDGPLMTHLIKKTKKMKLENNVRFLGARDDVDEILKSSDVYVAASPYENFPSLGLFEAMSCGLPVVATDVGETKTLIREQETLLLAKPEAYDIAEKISLLLCDQNLREKLGKNARQLILEKYSLEALGLDHEMLYYMVVRNRAK
jgi:glycosyltransferase involved in cell wall biosynthesis